MQLDSSRRPNRAACDRGASPSPEDEASVSPVNLRSVIAKDVRSPVTISVLGHGGSCVFLESTSGLSACRRAASLLHPGSRKVQEASRRFPSLFPDNDATS